MQAIYNIAEICAQKGIIDFILSPGSRCAPLTISIARHPSITVKTISDERSAAFIAIGVAQQSKNLVGLLCTSGSAAFNYAPAVAEAYYQQIPILILTADRPPEWIDQLDGQTIRQNNIFGSHVKQSFSLPSNYNHSDEIWHIERIISEAINLSQEFPKGPVHINIPLREPLYPVSTDINFNKEVKIISHMEAEPMLLPYQWEILKEEFQKYSKILIVVGQSTFDQEFERLSKAFTEKYKIPLIADVISNLHEVGIHHQDIILSNNEESLLENLKPDLLISTGLSNISKNLKLFLRKNKPKAHWHIQQSGYVADPFQSLTKVISVKSNYFFKEAFHFFQSQDRDERFYYQWKSEEEKAKSKLNLLFNKSPFGEFEAIAEVLQALPNNSILHLANSMAVRYANIMGINKNVEVFANRGTSGIDGVISTAYGAALATDKIVSVITGDLAFFYDRNAFWNNYLPKNLRVILLNNHGGGIFRIIDGPNKQPELDEYFETHQPLNAAHLAEEFGIQYKLISTREELKIGLNEFLFPEQNIKILEIETDSKVNTNIFKEFKNLIK